MHAAVAFNKIAGTLSLHHNQTLQWTPSTTSASTPAFTLAFGDIAGLQTSKAGSAQIALMLVLSGGVQIGGKPKVLLVFNAAQQTAMEDRERFKNDLAGAVARNRAEGGGSGSVTPASPAPVVSSPAAATPEPAATPPAKRQRKEAPRKTDIELRISVIKSNPSLRALHKDIVISGAMSDSEFWSHPSRQRLLRAERSKLEQRSGRNARLADPKPTPNEAGELKLSITPELIRDLFEQFPVAARAYEENVPSKLDEGSFWTRYFQSKLYHRLRTSARSAASESLVQDDAVFDQYLEEEDNGLQPRRQHNPHDRLLDLGATEEDHGETGNGKDWTMRAGAERRTLPLMRRFNDHSQSLLDSALGDQEEAERRKRRIVGGVGEEYTSGPGGGSGNPPKLGGGDGEDEEEAADSVDWIKNHYYKEIVIDDLTAPEPQDKVRLNMANLEGYFSSDSAPSSTTSGPLELNPQDLTEYLHYVQRFNEEVQTSSIDLGSFTPSRLGSESAMSRMLSNLRSRSLNPRAASDIKTLPDPLQKSLISLQASTTEFLRQFWNAIAPGPTLLDEEDENGESSSWSARNRELTEEDKRKREEKEREAEENRLIAARKMALNLAKFGEKLEDMFNTAGLGLDEGVEERVGMLLGPTGRAVERAVGIARVRGFIV